MKLLTRMWPGMLLVGLAVGCSGQGTGLVTGTVTVDGKPMGGFEVTYTSNTDGSVAVGFAIADGSYRLFRGRGNERIRVGSYKVTVAPSAFVDGCPLPTVKLQQTDLSKTVSSGQNVIDLPMESARR